VKTVCFQAALLYTSSKAERRIRVHTLCLPVTASLTDVLYSADVQCIVGLLAKMAVDRSLTSNLADARDAFINATVDVLSAFRVAQNLPTGTGSLVASQNLALLPLYILGLLKHVSELYMAKIEKKVFFYNFSLISRLLSGLGSAHDWTIVFSPCVK
jgi:protein transport protein SEC24